MYSHQWPTFRTSEKVLREPPAVASPSPPRPGRLRHESVAKRKREFPWYYAEDSGGYIMPYGDYKGIALHHIPLTDVLLLKRHDTAVVWEICCIEAVKKYLIGLESYSDTHYEHFIVPFPCSYQGRTLQQVRNNPWMQELGTEPEHFWLRIKYPIFFKALSNWLRTPRHHATKRDVGQLLTTHEYSDNEDLYMSGNEYTLNDGFVVPDEPVAVQNNTQVILQPIMDDVEAEVGHTDDASVSSKSGSLIFHSGKSSQLRILRLPRMARRVPVEVSSKNKKKKEATRRSRRGDSPAADDFIVHDSLESSEQPYSPSEPSLSSDESDISQAAKQMVTRSQLRSRSEAGISSPLCYYKAYFRMEPTPVRSASPNESTTPKRRRHTRKRRTMSTDSITEAPTTALAARPTPEGLIPEVVIISPKKRVRIMTPENLIGDEQWLLA